MNKTKLNSNSLIGCIIFLLFFFYFKGMPVWHTKMMMSCVTRVLESRKQQGVYCRLNCPCGQQRHLLVRHRKNRLALECNGYIIFKNYNNNLVQI